MMKNIIGFPHKLNIVLEGWYGLRMRLQYYTPLKNLHSKGANFEKFAAAHSAAKVLSISVFSSTSCGTAWPLHFKFASCTYVL